MKTSETQALIDHIQDIVQPVGRLSYPPDMPSDYPRQPPWWVLEPVADSPRISPDDELVIETEIESSELIDASKEVDQDRNPDVYAYYCPYHFYKDGWGIYIKASGILAISAHILNTGRLTPSNSAIINSVFKLLLHHECFHFWTEMACSRYEIPMIDFSQSSGSLYVPYKSYFRAIKAIEHEEAMANANALLKVRDFHRKAGLISSEASSIQSLLSHFMESQPPGYKEFGSYLENSEHNRGKDKVLDHIRELAHLAAGTSDQASQVPGRRYFLDRQVPPCPIYLVKDGLSSSLTTVRPFPALSGMRILVHTNEHNPPHFHLEFPIGTEIGRYEWPDLRPLKGAKSLSTSEKKRLDKYLGQYRAKIDRKIKSVFG